ncbi:hypothetical protein CEH05_07540 [Halobacillus halophilus]|nr:hypothetical protein CEH05_07540 [Halobacillus halophilus]
MTLSTIETFVIKAEWFDYVFYTLALTGVILFAMDNFKKHKILLTLVAVILFFAYAYELVRFPLP